MESALQTEPAHLFVLCEPSVGMRTGSLKSKRACGVQNAPAATACHNNFFNTTFNAHPPFPPHNITRCAGKAQTTHSMKGEQAAIHMYVPTYLHCLRLLCPLRLLQQLALKIHFPISLLHAPQYLLIPTFKPRPPLRILLPPNPVIVI